MPAEFAKLPAVWTRGLPPWYQRHGRHHLPWRQTREPWPILVSEIMLQQTQVSRVIGRWESFLARWPTPRACAAATLNEVLHEWQGLGYPRRARDLHAIAIAVSAGAWPRDEAGLRALPGLGAYTARALMTLALQRPSPLPHDINISRVAARCALGVEPSDAPGASLDSALEKGRPTCMSRRDYTYALFDVGAMHCRARPRCTGCPLAARCASRHRLAQSAPPRGRRAQPPYRGSMRELRGEILRVLLAADPPGDMPALLARLPTGTDRSPERIGEALASLMADRLVPVEVLTWRRDTGISARR